ncbi:16S rRNA (uracil(1498)-N(3))-methyltransferase [Haematomicrobium sanguinis]|uniref:16S rRNA (uracil(1498)-N(3))-methyltransferase n=1 Tax=Haematomicrobium sanguinis TaxID=479106 RepID=UPI00047CDE7F|nr:16S rRNA (uracil(1498)-N(3))-methyltransferase [Haematomicrobium sanguinis]
MSLPVFVIDVESARTLRPGDSYTLDGPEGRHAAGSMRLAAGESLDLVNGRGARWRATVKESAKNSLLLDIQSATTEEAPSPEVTVVQALAKGGRDEQAVESAVELGATAIVPWQADRSIVRWRDEKAKKGTEKWQDLVRSAAKQSRQSHIPTVSSPETSAQLCQRIRRAVGESGGHAVVLHESATEPLVSFLRETGPGPLLLIVGPEGGITPSEVEAMVASGARTAHLGQRILRSSSAGPAALAAINTQWERW